MILCALGYGYLSKYVFRRICGLGVTAIGVTSQQIKDHGFSNRFFVIRKDIKKAISFSTHLLITAPPNSEGCVIFNKYANEILNSNVKSIIYISSTGVYGNHNGNWVDEKSLIKANSSYDKRRVKAEKQWKKFCIKHNINLNIVRIAGIYGPKRFINVSEKELIVVLKRNHYFSRIHILDAARLVTKIILENYKNEVWNLADDLPSSREALLSQVIRVKKITKYSTIAFDKYSKNLSEKSKKFWLNNKRVSNHKIKDHFEYKFIFPTYINGVNNLKEYI
ncbi:MAG: hypothetical protein CML36_01875 [Rhodobacteraceae bacterium]|nr:hypothetical protein [Paracoccaceae bacterium]OUU62470.1 MAG: hypothetical protein CBC22_04065 [Alphaproteobacteria bacterium TMED62]|tara:strand:- start:12201 stop:13037 length:837 start_codon:yes stop_codon:yes gene_type:complete